MQKQIKILLTLITVLILAVSCAKNNPNDPTITDNANFSKLQKTWQDTAYNTSQYVITDSKFDSLYNNSTSYSFDIKYISWTSDTAGIIYGQYTANSYSPEVVGKYYAVSFKDLTDTTVKISGAYKYGGVSATDTLEEAKTTFTEVDGYFGVYSDCTAVAQ
ncbi:hypothetical protein R4K54_01810 [Brachyspira murdochii]|uniref:hypothetical protein n=1 Tax=Brachyspira murdochii TaxID=84378 RepID=UPI00300621E7